LQVLYDYLSDRELAFKRRFNTIFESLKNGRFEITHEDDLRFGDAEQREFDSFIAFGESVLPHSF